MKWIEQGRERMHKQANSIGNFLVEGFHYLGLFAIGAATAFASFVGGAQRRAGSAVA